MKSTLSTNHLVCNMDVFTPEEREQHVRLTGAILSSLRGVEDIPAGARFTFPNDADLIPMLADFIQKEQRCCPFLEFTLKIPSAGSIELLLTGPEGTPEFLRSEFDEAFQ